MSHPEHPPAAAHFGFDTLTPDVMLDALQAQGLWSDGRLLQLNSYENRVFQIGLDDGSWVVAKFYRPGRWTREQILEEHAWSLQLAQAEIPVIAPLVVQDQTLHTHEGYLWAVFPRRGGRPPELEIPETLERIGHFLGRIHATASQPFVHRPSLTPAHFGHDAIERLRRLESHSPGAWSVWHDAATRALALVEQKFQQAGPAMIRCHGDTHQGNILWTDAGPHFVDLDDARNAPAVQDLWMLLAGTRQEMASQLSEVLAGYEEHLEFDRRQLQLIEPLRTLRLIHHSAWLAERWVDPAFPIAFPWFGTENYWQQQALQLREQVEAMQDDTPWWV